ncbi:MAG: DNA polymerase III subunit alpha [Candidatus Berkelbacteria bacterium]
MSDTSPQFVHLHTHSHYSMLDGMGKIPDLVAKAKELGQKSLALTDHGVMHGVVEFYEECLKQGIKPIIGCEMYVAPRTLRDKTPKIDQHPYHLILLAKNNEGYKNLIALSSIAHLEGYYYKPRIDKETLKKYSKGLFASSACIQGEIPRKAMESYDLGKQTVEEYIDIFGKDNLALEVQKHTLVDDQDKINDLMFKLAKEYDLPVVATNDIHYVEKTDDVAQDALICLQTGRQMADSNRLTMVGDNYSFLSGDEIVVNFPEHPEVLENTVKIAEKCDVTIELGQFKFPDFPLPDGETYETYLYKMIYDRLAKTVPEITPVMRERIEYEFKVIKDKGYLGYFLIVQDFFHWAKKNNIPTNTRGSAAGCFVSYALGITQKQLNPLDFNLPFERFLNPFRPSAPDIDIDIADSGRDAIIHYVSEKYGKDHVAQIITFGTMAARMAVRDVGRVLGLSYSEVDIIAKLIPPIKTTLSQALETVSELKNLYDSSPETKKCIDIAKRLEGVVRHASVHAAGVVISPEVITNYTPIMNDSKKDRIITQYEMHAVGEDGIGLIKMDFLGLANLSIIQNVLKIVRKTRGIEIKLDEIPLDNEKTFKLLARGETIGVFQLESEGMRKNIKELQPTTIHDIMAMVALYRPGPMAFIPEYIRRKHNPASIVYPDPRLKNILANSHGLIVYQDDVLMIAIELAGYNWMEVDKFRKAIGKKIVAEMGAQKEKFFKQIIERGMEESVATQIWEQIETFAGYGFNKAHAASYGLVAYQTAYLKSNYPPEYMSALMTSNKDDLDKLAMEIDECTRMGIKVLPPSVNESFVDFGVVVDTGNVRFGLSAVKNVGKAVAEEIVRERESGGVFKDLPSLLTRLNEKVINKKSLESLVMSGALDDLVERAEALYNMPKILEFSSQIRKNKSANQNSLFGDDIAVEAKLNLETTKPAPKKLRLQWERELLGIYVSEHPLTDAMHLIEPNRSIKLSELKDGEEGQFVRVCGIVTTIQKILTRNKDQMFFVRMEDSVVNCEVLIFPKILEKYRDTIASDKIITVDGFLSFKDGSAKILADEIYEVTETARIPEFIPREKRRNGYGYKNNNGGGGGQTQTFVPGAPLPKHEIHSFKIIIPKGSSKDILGHIKLILTQYGGDTPVTLSMPNNGSGFKDVVTSAKVDVGPVLANKIKDIVGKDNVVIN